MSKQTLALVKWGLRMVAWAFGVMVVVLVGLHLVSGLIALIGSGRMSLFDFGDFLAGEVYGAWNMAVLIFALCFPYTIFKWGLQYNITRRHIWLANSCLLLVLVVTSWGLALLKNLFLYSTHHLSHFADGAGWTLLTILVGVVTVATIGAGFALLNRLWKWIVGIGGPIVLIFIMVSLVRFLFVTLHLDPATVFGSLQFLATHTAVMIGIFLWLAVMVALNYCFFMKMQLRRD
ncbi:hypothetical protein [Limosilactobacillus ingluviei]|uniref:hypothetical protein n=1 Tax=Limosilactobacillus ingluviei TaxID=148604 RepID=UPI0023F4AFD6|nr:hypothetical protein [Limosilactobacillus ingluviei]MDO4603290.1 hypothetical protein [Limosilactobacillus ingluviei]